MERDTVTTGETTRLNINISHETAKALRHLADVEGTSVTNIVRRAVAVYKFLDDEMRESDKVLQIYDKTNKERTTVAFV